MGPVAAPAVPALAQAIRNPNEKLRLACARTLRNIGPPARLAINELIDMGDTRYWRFRFAARDALAAIGPEVVVVVRRLDQDELKRSPGRGQGMLLVADEDDRRRSRSGARRRSR